MTPTDPPHRRPGQPPGPPPLPARAAGPTRDVSPSRAPKGPLSPAAAGPVVDWRLLALAVAGAAVVGGGLVALIGLPGGGGNVDVAVRPAPEPSPLPARPLDPPPAVVDSPPVRSPDPAPPPRPDPALDRRQAFRHLKARLEQGHHLPVDSKLGSGADEGEPMEVCNVGGAEIELSLPNVPAFTAVAKAPQWRLSLENQPPGQWTIVATDSAIRHQIAHLAVSEGALSLTLLPLPKEPDQADVCRRARVAALTLPLVLRLPGESSVEFETYVQLCQPKRLDPIRIERFLTDKRYRAKSEAKPGETIIHDPLPATPWACTVELEGKAGEGVTANVAPEAWGNGARNLADWFAPEPLAMTARWSWSGQGEAGGSEPFMVTDFTLGNREEDPSGLTGGAFELQLTKSEVLEPWSSWKRLGDFKEISKPEAKSDLPFPIPGALARVPDRDELKFGELAPYLDLARLHLPKYSTQASAAVRKTLEHVAGRLAQQQDLPQASPKSLAFWKEAIRVTVGATPGYVEWVTPKVPSPGPPPKPGDDGKVNPDEFNAWEQKQRAHELSLHPLEAPKLNPIPEDKLDKFWQDLQDAPPEKRCEPSVMLCSLYFEIDEVLAEKRQARRLLEAVGDGTVEFTGRVWVDAMNNGQHRVLLAEFKADEPDDDSRADETPDKTKDAAPAGEAASVAPSAAGPVVAEGDADQTGTE
jgi:hypothetical protein